MCMYVVFRILFATRPYYRHLKWCVFTICDVAPAYFRGMIERGFWTRTGVIVMFALRHPALKTGRPFRLTLQTRLASTNSQSPQNTLKKGLYTAVVAVSTGLFAVYYFDSRSAIHRYIITPTLRYALDPEASHRLAVRALANGFGPRDTQVDDERLKFEVIRDRHCFGSTR